MNLYQPFVLAVALIWTSISHASAVQTGDLLISEVLANPAAVSDSQGEFFELFNPTSNVIDINGFNISDDGSNSHSINASNPLLILPGEYFVLGISGEVTSNGGYFADYIYSGFSLTNSSDEIILSNTDNVEIARLEFSGSPFGVSGVSAELVNQLLQPEATDYALSTEVFGEGDRGTPGQAGSTLLTSAASPVPVPAAFWLFGSAIFMLARLKHSRKMSPAET